MSKPDGRTTRWEGREEIKAQREASRKSHVFTTFIPDARKYKCHGCTRMAHAMHHQSYHVNDMECWVPLCGSCHGRVHANTLDLTYGVVPSRVGLIRIAIAYPQELHP